MVRSSSSVGIRQSRCPAKPGGEFIAIASQSQVVAPLPGTLHTPSPGAHTLQLDTPPIHAAAAEASGWQYLGSLPMLQKPAHG